MNTNDLAYMAGLFDGEGSVEYTRRWEKRTKERKYKVWRITLEMSMTDEYVMKWFHETLGFGSLRKRLPIKSWKGKKTQWRWSCSHREALVFAKLLWPHTQVKLHKLEQIMDHYDPGYNTENVVALEDYR